MSPMALAGRQTVTSVLLLVARCRGCCPYSEVEGPKASGGPSGRRVARPGRRGPRWGPPSQPPGKARPPGTLGPLALGRGQPSAGTGVSGGKGSVPAGGGSSPPNRL